MGVIGSYSGVYVEASSGCPELRSKNSVLRDVALAQFMKS